MDGSDRTTGEEKGPKPTPIREVVGEPRPSAPRRPDESRAEVPSEHPAPGMRGQRERPRGPRDDGRSRGRGRGRGKGRPTPVPAREALDRQALEPTAVDDLPSRQFTSEGVEWIVRLSGRTSAGSASDAGAPLLHLTFYRADNPLVAEREALIPGASMEGLFESELNNVLSSAGQASSPDQPSEAPPKPARGANEPLHASD